MNKVKYICLFLIPLGSGIGSWFTLFGFAPIRIISILLFVAVFLTRPKMNNLSISVLLFGILWLTWGIVGLQDANGAKELLGVAVGGGTILVLLIGRDSKKWFQTLYRGWLFAWVVAVLPACYEIITKKHLSNYLKGSPLRVRLAAKDVASFFINPNLFAYFLVTAMVFLVVGWQLETGRWAKIYFCAAAFSPIIIWATGSRIVLISSIPVIVWMLVKSKGLRISVASGIMIASASVLVLGLLDKVLAAFFTSIKNLESKSGHERLGLYRNAWWMFEESNFLGIGAAQFRKWMLKAIYPTYGAVDPHSGISEIFSQYGILIGLVATGFLLAAIFWSFPVLFNRETNKRRQVLQIAVLIMLLVTPLLSFANSSYLASPIIWVQLGTLFVAWQEGLKEKHQFSLGYKTSRSQTIPENRRLIKLNTCHPVNIH